MANFGRVLTAMVTPFNSKMEVDYEKAEKLARYLVDNGSDGIVVVGTTGESPTLTDEEKIKLFKVVVDAVGNRAKIIAGTGSNDTNHSIYLTKEAEKAGVHGILAVAPYYNKPPQEGLYNHFKLIAESTKLPVILYNIPGRSSVNISPDTVARLAQIDNIVAVKEASGSLNQASEIRSKTPEDFIIYSGEDSITLPMLAIGCYGVISVVSHVVGTELQAMIKAFLAGDMQTATKMHLELFPMFKGLFITTNPIPIKTALNLMGHDVGGLRPPLVSASEQEKAAIKNLLVSYKKL